MNIEESLHVKHQTGSNKFRLWNVLVCTQNSGSAVTCLYISIKLLYTINVVGQVRAFPLTVHLIDVLIVQILLLNTFLGNHSNWYGVEVMNDLMHNREWDESGNFPRVTLCDFEVKVGLTWRSYNMHCVRAPTRSPLVTMRSYRMVVDA